MTDPEERHEERWIYIGKREARTGAPLHVWLDPNGNERAFTGLKGTTPGNIYIVTVIGEGEQVLKKARYTGEQHPDAAARQMWDAEHRAAEVTYEARRKDRVTEGELASHLNVLRVAYHGQRTHARKAALLAQFLEEITR